MEDSGQRVPNYSWRKRMILIQEAISLFSLGNREMSEHRGEGVITLEGWKGYSRKVLGGKIFWDGGIDHLIWKQGQTRGAPIARHGGHWKEEFYREERGGGLRRRQERNLSYFSRFKKDSKPCWIGGGGLLVWIRCGKGKKIGIGREFLTGSSPKERIRVILFFLGGED